jgi:hypothetical protein
MLLLTYLGLRRVSSKGSLLFVLLATFFWTTIALAQDYRGTSDQTMSCTPDAFRLCAGYIPDGAKVENCLRQNLSNLSAACRSVFDQKIRSAVSINK